MHRLFTAHPASVNQSYGEHMAFAANVGLRMVGGGVATLVHAVLPFLFATTGSRVITGLHARIMAAHRRPLAPREAAVRVSPLT